MSNPLSEFSPRSIFVPTGSEMRARQLGEYNRRPEGDYVRRLGAETVVAIGQGANDAEMLKAAALGICVMSVEGAAVESLPKAYSAGCRPCHSGYLYRP